MRYFVNEEGGVEMARDGVRGKKSTDLVVYVINEATKLLKGTSVLNWAIAEIRPRAQNGMLG